MNFSAPTRSFAVRRWPAGRAGLPRAMLCWAVGLALLTGTGRAALAGGLSTQLEAHKRVITADTSGRPVESWQPFTQILPGEPVRYTVHCRNDGEAPAADVVVSLPIPDALTLVVPAPAPDVRFLCSVDGGTQFAALAELTVPVAEGRRRPAGPADVTHVRWQLLTPIAPGARTEVSCQMLLE